MSDITRPKRQRAAHRGHIKKSIDEIESILLVTLSDENKYKVTSLISVVKAKLLVIEKLDEEIISGSKDEDLDDELADVELNTTEFMYQLGVVEAKFKALVSSLCAENTLTQNSTTIKVASKLENLPVPIWRGDRKSYAGWKKSFNNSMRKHGQDEEDQLQRVKKAVEDVEKIWKTRVESCNNIQSVWNLLDTEFNDVEKLILEIYQDIENLKVKNDSKGLSDFAQAISDFIRYTTDAGEPQEAHSRILMKELRKKLIPEHQRNFFREMRKENKAQNAENLMIWLRDEAALLSLCPEEKVHSCKSHAVEGVESIKRNPTCYYCGQANHNVWECAEFSELSTSQRWDAMKQKKLCHKCFSKAHFSKDCKARNCIHCGRRHHQLLHNEENLHVQDSNDSSHGLNHTQPTAVLPEHNVESRSTTMRGKGGHVQCPVVKVLVWDIEGKPKEALAMLDSANNSTLISKKLARKLGLTGEKCILSMDLAGGNSATENSEAITLNVSPLTNMEEKITVDVHTVNKPSKSAKTISRKQLEQHSHLKPILDQVHLAGGAVDILIGTDLTEAFIDFKCLVGKPGEPIAKQNLFGWSVLGRIDDKTQIQPTVNYIEKVEVKKKPETEIIENMLNLLIQDQVGVKPTKMCTCTDAELKENRFIKLATENTEIVGDRVKVRSPWRENGPPTKSNYEAAKGRMLSKEKQLRKNGRLETVNAGVLLLLESGFVILIPNEMVDHNKPERYLPILEIITLGKSTEIRLVFDASDKDSEGLSLNDRLEKGPCYINVLPDVLIVWRWDNIAFCGDIRKMFNQILLHEDDQIFHRFLWRNGEETVEPQVYQWVRLNFGDKPAPDLATNCIRALAKMSELESPQAAQVLLHQSYVDDIAGSCREPSETLQVTEEIDAILQKGSFTIKAWHSNSKEVDKTEEETTSVLGLKWNKTSDKFKMKGSSEKTVEISLETKELDSKRKCLGFTAQNWDPLGTTMPCSINFRIDLQEIWALGYGWDDVLPDHIRRKWSENVAMMEKLMTMEFDRKLKPDNAVGVPEVHGFSDAGELAYGAVIFLRWQLGDGSFVCVPVISKALVAPLKTRSIPRLELMSCVLLVRLLTETTRILKSVGADSFTKYLWNDSKVAIAWISSSSREYKPFVSSRVAEIQESLAVMRESLKSKLFNYVRSKDNPADALTRGIEPDKLDIWSKGPDFLKLHETLWPKPDSADCASSSEVEAEKKTSKNSIEKSNPQGGSVHVGVDVHVTTVKEEEEYDEPNPILEQLTDRCSTFSKIRRTVGFVQRFIDNKTTDKNRTEPLSVEELQNAQKRVLKWSQKQMDFEELGYDKSLQGVDAQRGEDGIWRAHGRLENIRNLPASLKNPIILDGKQKIVKLLLIHIHEKIGHCGYKRLMSEIKQQYWVIGLRALAKSIVVDCVVCRKLRGNTLSQIMGQLPELRTRVGFSAFSSTGIDMFGPVKIKLNRRTLSEAQVIMFCCLTARIIHLELVSDKSTDTFLMAFRRFACLRGHPSKCWSDRGTNFVGAQHYLREIMAGWDIPKIKNVLAMEFDCDFEWEWNIPYASHMNGAVESLIKSVRQALNATCTNIAQTEEQWRTTLAEIAYMINSRPLYPASPDIWEAPPITPNDLLFGPHLSPPQPETEDRVNPRHLTRCVQSRAADFWSCWLKYFAPNLLPRNEWYHPRENVKIGDLVLEIDSRLARAKWNLALVIKVYPGSDDKVRKVCIKTQDGEYERPIHKLCLIATKEELEQN